MLKELFYPLVRYVSFFNIFQYISFRAAYAAVTALLISFLFGPAIIRWLRRINLGQVVRKDGPESHLSKAGTPTMGGVLINVSIICSVFLWQDLRNPYAWVIILSSFGFGLLGFADDYLKISRKNSDGLRAKFKLLGQLSLSLILVLVIMEYSGEHTTLLYLPFIKTPVLDFSYFYIPFGMLVLVGTSNAVNLTDGLDGLATGLVIMVVLSFAVIAYLTGRVDFAEYLQIPFVPGAGELAVAAMGILGACIGFLWFNAHPAEVMMGDTGSLSLGGLIGVMALMLKKEILLVIVGGVFVMEVFSVVIQVLHFKRTGKRVFKMSPLHHHFELSGWSETKVVTRFWILGGMFALLALSTLKIR